MNLEGTYGFIKDDIKDDSDPRQDKALFAIEFADDAENDKTEKYRKAQWGHKKHKKHKRIGSSGRLGIWEG